MVLCCLLGFSCGVPLLAIDSTLKIWLGEQGVALSAIALASYFGLPYTLKFLWAPLLDRYLPPLFGRRRGWMLVAQVGVALSLVTLGYTSATETPILLGLAAFLCAFFSASQDIVVDAHRREMLPDHELAPGAGQYVFGYRLGMLVGGAGALWLSDQPDIGWQLTYAIVASSIIVGVIATLLAPEPPYQVTERTVRDAVVQPVAEFFRRYRIVDAVAILLFAMIYKFGDTFAGALTSVFYREAGYSKTEIAFTVKVLGLIGFSVGALLGGYLTPRLGMMRALWYFGLLQALSTAVFVVLTMYPPTPVLLWGVVTFENLTSAMGTAAFAAFLAGQCNRDFTATQYAVLTSLMAVPRTLFGGLSGFVTDALGWNALFVSGALLAIPGMLLIEVLGRIKPRASI